MVATTLVVPCYNEEKRLRVADFVSWLANDPGSRDVTLLFVDDGSRDGTVDVLQQILGAVPTGRASVLQLGVNCGKAEAVRRGMLEAMHTGAASGAGPPPEVIGFWDCDLATPLQAVPQLAAILATRPEIQMVFGARVALLGRRIQRSPVRHYLGRVFATLASLSLDLPIYDTQCGAKLFRATPTLRTVITAPFLTRWVFDCEMIARFHASSPAVDALDHEQGASAGAAGSSGARGRGNSALAVANTIFEFPLEEWVDVAGSKVKPTDILKMAYGLLNIRRVYFHREWPSGRPRPQYRLEACTFVAIGLLLGLVAGLVATTGAILLARALL